MSRDVAFAAVKLGMENNKSSGLLFYGGEPLLEKQLIYDIVDYTQRIKKETGHIFYYKITTNGTLLDERFIKMARDVNMTISFSHDGPAQDDNRIFYNGDGSFDVLKDKIPLLLKYLPYSVAMSVIDPATVHKASSIVKFLFEKGFRYITINLNYSKDAPWTKEHLKVLEDEYKKMAELYLKWTKAEEKFYLSPFDMKILSHLKGEKYAEDRLQMNRNQPSVAPNGNVFPASRYVDDDAFVIGDVFLGIDSDKRKALEEKELIPITPCLECAIRTRCNYTCVNLVRQENEIFPEISPVQCAHEQILTPIVDNVAEKLYSERNALFIHKHYNELYPVMSFVEDKSRIG